MTAWALPSHSSKFCSCSKIKGRKQSSYRQGFQRARGWLATSRFAFKLGSDSVLLAVSWDLSSDIWLRMIKALITRHVFQVFLLFWWAKFYKRSCSTTRFLSLNFKSNTRLTLIQDAKILPALYLNSESKHV